MTLFLMILGIVLCVASVFGLLMGIDDDNGGLIFLGVVGILAGIALAIVAVVIDNNNFHDACIASGGSAVVEQYGADLCIDSDGRIVPVP